MVVMSADRSDPCNTSVHSDASSVEWRVVSKADCSAVDSAVLTAARKAGRLAGWSEGWTPYKPGCYCSQQRTRAAQEGRAGSEECRC